MAEAISHVTLILDKEKKKKKKQTNKKKQHCFTPDHFSHNITTFS